MPLEKLLTVDEAAGALNTTPRFVRRKLPSGRWQASFKGPGGRRQTAPHTFSTRTDADRWLAAAELDISRGTWLNQKEGRVPFAEYAKQWIDDNPRLGPRSKRRTTETSGSTWHHWPTFRSSR
jgi:hypothetical protein